MKRLSMVLIPLCAGCYTYRPIRPAEVVPGMSVRAHVSTETSDRIAPLLGLSGVNELTGTVIDDTGGTMIIEVPTVVQEGVNNATQSLFQRVTVHPGDVLGLESRKLDRVRTVLLVGAAVAAVGSVAVKALKGNPGIEAPPPQSGGTETRVPLIRIFF